MITKSELQAAKRGLPLPEPPTAEEMLAFSRGELSEADEERVRTALAAHPDLARTLSEPFPENDARPGEPGYVSDARMAQSWESLRARTGLTEPQEQGARVLRFWRASALATAAALVLAFGGLIWQTRSNLRLERELTLPRVTTASQVLFPDEGQRGPSHEGPALPDADTVLLTIPLANAGRFEHYRLELVDPSQHTVWRSQSVQPSESDSFSITVPRGSLTQHGRYQVVVYGIAGARDERLATYSVRVR